MRSTTNTIIIIIRRNAESLTPIDIVVGTNERGEYLKNGST